jgi:hypothetical protein
MAANDDWVVLLFVLAMAIPRIIDRDSHAYDGHQHGNGYVVLLLSFIIIMMGSTMVNADTLLLNGQPSGLMTVAFQSNTYFYFINSVDSLSIRFNLTAITGDPDLWISQYSDFRLPWYQGDVGSELVIINATDSKRNNSLPYYYIAVYGFSASSFIITVNTFVSSSSFTQIVNGQPSGLTTVPYHSYTYFYFINDGVETDSVSVRFNLTAITGDPDLYVSQYTTLSPYWYHGSVGSDLLIINANDSTRNNNLLTYYIAVYGFSASSFVMTVDTISSISTTSISSSSSSSSTGASSSSSSSSTGVDPTVFTQVVNGQPSGLMTVAYHTDTYFFFFNNGEAADNVSIRFNVTAITGDPDIYVTQYGSWSPYWYEGHVGSELLIITPTDSTRNRTLPYFYIAVYGFSASTFIIAVDTISSGTIISSSSSTGKSSSSRMSSSSSTGVIIITDSSSVLGYAIGIPAGVVVLVGIIIAFVLYRRRSAAATAKASSDPNKKVTVTETPPGGPAMITPQPGQPDMRYYPSSYPPYPPPPPSYPASYPEGSSRGSICPPTAPGSFTDVQDQQHFFQQQQNVFQNGPIIEVISPPQNIPPPVMGGAPPPEFTPSDGHGFVAGYGY